MINYKQKITTFKIKINQKYILANTVLLTQVCSFRSKNSEFVQTGSNKPAPNRTPAC